MLSLKCNTTLNIGKKDIHAVVITLCRLWDKNRALPNLPKDEIKNKVLKYITDYVKKADQIIQKKLKELKRIYWKYLEDGKRYSHLNLEV